MEHTYTLRRLKAADAERMLEWMRNDNVTEFLQIGGKDVTLQTVQNFIAAAQDESRNLHRAIVDENDVYYGTVSLKHIDNEKKEAEYAIAMHMDGIGRGAAKIASELILSLAIQQLQMKRVYLYVRKDNQRAIRFYEKTNWKHFEPEECGNEYLWFDRTLK